MHMSKHLLILSALCGSLSAQITAVANGAGFGTAVTAGSWATVFGTFAGVTTTTAPGFPLPKTLAGVTVAVAGVEAPVYFVNAGQINILIPTATTPGLHPIRVATAGGNFDSNVQILSAAPGLFTQGLDTPPKSAARNQNSTENTDTNRAVRGEVIQIYGSGPGNFTAPVIDGAGAPSSPLTQTRSTPQVFIGGAPAQVQFSGLAPGFPGLWQVNAFIPTQVLSGRVPVVVYVDGVNSNEVYIFVQ
jgi:uncharacterized protein (TIGR03437 family)